MQIGDGETTQGAGVQRPPLSEVTSAVCTLAELMSDHGLTSVDLTIGEIAIRLSASSALPVVAGPVVASPPPSSIVESPPASEGELLTAPMIGTFYASPAPGEPAFVAIGDEIEVGQVIGIIEAMKIMNEITAEQSGTVTEIMVQNAQAVEYGSPLLRVVAN
ncbi:MAG TPA: acetyl-CoA carboxylase biotin carboxyl carrier protein [Thermomicrobiales bacterium]|nr:acetyl-CoA carboxylase biotin carboxyl carrier protein [Thermomicrobiales bacterium]